MRFKKSIAVLLSLIMVFSVFTVIPVMTADATGEVGESDPGESGSGQSSTEATEPGVEVIENHKITVDCEDHATLTADKVWATKGQTVNLTLTIDPGYRLKKWGLTPADLVIENNSFVMPDSDVVVLAYIEEIPWHNITVTTNGHGTASASAGRVQEGDALTLSASPDPGYILLDWNVVSGGVTIENNGFVMLTEDVEIEAVVASGRNAGNYDNLKDALRDGSGAPIFLKNDIQAEGLTNVFNNTTAILDLNGHTLSRDGDIVVLVYGNLTIRDTKGGGKITGGTSCGVRVGMNGTLTLEGGEISGNASSGFGGGIYVSSGTIIMKGGTVCHNSAPSYGGGIYLSNAAMTMSGGTVSSNSASARGGGIYLTDNSSLTMTGGVISENSAIYGGGVYAAKGCSFRLTDGEISSNTADSYGGVYLESESTLNIEGGSVTGNEAAYVPAVCFDGTCNISGGSITGNVGTDSQFHGAVRVSSNYASLRLSGDPIIKDNFVGGQQSNVYLISTNNLTITGELADTAHIGIEKENDGVFTSGLNGKGEAYFVTRVNSVTVNTNNSFGTASASVSSAEGGTVVTLTATPNEDYYLKEWVVVSGGVTIENDQFVMPYKPVVIRAIFEQITYPVTVTVEPSAGGTSSASKNPAPRNQPVFLEATPNTGYRLKEWQVVSGSVTIEEFMNGGSEDPAAEMCYGFYMPGEPVEIKAIFEKIPYSVSVSSQDGGTAAADKNEAAEGDIVTVTVSPDGGYRLGFYDGSVELAPTDTPNVYEFEMPAYDVWFEFFFDPLYAIYTDGNVDTYPWYDLITEPITSAGEFDEVFIVLKENAIPDEGKYFTGEYTVDNESLGRDVTDPWANYIDHFDMPDHAVTVAAVQADKEALTVDLRSGEAVELSYDTFILLVTADRIPRLYPDEGDDILFDLDSSGTPDVRLYLVEERDENEVVTSVAYYAVKADNADATGRHTFDYSGSTVRCSTISFVLPGGVIRGDADGNGQVTILDATIIQRRLASLHVSSFAEEAADATGDGELSILDATAIQRYLASLPTNEAIGQPMS